MLRLTEAVLFLLPLALAAGWFAFGRRLPARVVWSSVLLVMAFAAATVWYGLERRLPMGAAYVPAQLVDGRIVAGHAAPLWTRP